jgi:hypothetical protein
MKATFVGDPSQPEGTEAVPETFEAYGLKFEKGKPTEIPKELEGKFAGNNHFQVEGAKKPEPEAEKPEAETAAGTSVFSSDVEKITDREEIENMLKTEKRPMARGVLERRLDALPKADKARASDRK